MTHVDPLICDLYARDLGGRPNLAALLAAGPPWHGIGLKATEGTRYDGGEWFRTNWALARTLAEAAERYGVDFWRFPYHYLHVEAHPEQQADLHMRVVERAGGWGPGDLWSVVDVERADNPDAEPAFIVDCVTKYAERWEAITGYKPTLYGGSWLADKGITSHMGCGRLWIARYTATLPTEVETRIGWSPKDLLMWQYDGDGESHLAGYPQTSPMGACDISAVTIAGGGAGALDYLRKNASTLHTSNG